MWKTIQKKDSADLFYRVDILESWLQNEQVEGEYEKGTVMFPNGHLLLSRMPPNKKRDYRENHQGVEDVQTKTIGQRCHLKFIVASTYVHSCTYK